MKKKLAVVGGKVKGFSSKVMKSSAVTTAALMLVGVSQVMASDCVWWIFGQDEMPEELLEMDYGKVAGEIERN